MMMRFWHLVTNIGNLWVLLSNVAVHSETVTASIADNGFGEAAFLMVFFAAFALLAALG